MDWGLREHRGDTAIAFGPRAKRAPCLHLLLSRIYQQFRPRHFASVSRLVILLVGMLGFLTVLNGCSQESGQMQRQKDFEQALKNAIASRNDWIDIASLVNFEWEKVCVMAPYAAVFPDETIASKYDVFKEIPWITSETYWTVVFIDKHSKVVPLKVHRSNIAEVVDPMNRDSQCASRNNAKFLLLLIVA